MSDDKSKRGKPDRSRINFSQYYEVAHAAGMFRCTDLELFLLAQAVRSNDRARLRQCLSQARQLIRNLKHASRKPSKRPRLTRRRAGR